MPRVLSVYLPRWPIQCVSRGLGRERGPRNRLRSSLLVLTARDRGGDVIAGVSKNAEALGVRLGFSLAQARALISEAALHVEPFRPDEYATKLQRLARWAERFSPVSAADPTEGLLLDITGCAGFFGGENGLVQQAADSLHRLGFEARLAIAPTVGSAWAVAHYGSHRITVIADAGLRQTVPSLPIAALRLRPRTLEGLAEIGLARIADLLPLPRSDLAARFDGEVLHRLDQLLGLAGENLFSEPRERSYEAAREFDGAVTQTEVLEAALRQLLHALVAQLAAGGVGVSRLDMHAARVDASATGFTLTLTYPTRDEAHLWSLMRPQFERMPLGFGVEGLRLRASRTGRMTCAQMTLWNDAQLGQVADTTALGEFLDLLVGRFGRAAVTRYEPVESYVPEDAFAARPWTVIPATKMRSRLLSANRPTRLFDPPEPVRVMALVPDGPPEWLEWRGRNLGVQTRRGPERIACPWWATKHFPIVRDYYEIELEGGRFLWVFRAASARDSAGWFVHGEWA